MDKQPPPPYGMMQPPMHQPMQQPMQQPGVIIVQTPALGPQSTTMSCPHCHANILTRVEQASTSKTHLFALLLCILGCWPCAPCPYCMDTCLLKKHFCPACNSYLGSYDGA